MNEQSMITEVKGVGEAQAKKLAHLHIKTVGDLLHYYPRRYQDFSSIVQIKDIRPGEVTVAGKVSQIKGRYVRRGMHITEAMITDKSGSVRLIWFNQPYRANSIKSSEQYFVSGKFELGRGRMSIMNPSIELASSFPVNTARIVPIYPEVKDVKSVELRRALREVLNSQKELNDTLPPAVEIDYKLVSYKQALMGIHFPNNPKELERARKRLGFAEVFELVLAHLVAKQQFAQEVALPISFDEKLAKKFVSSLPFKLTDSQRLAVWETYKDIQTATPMNRLIEGDVGSGKTVVAAMAAAMAISKGFQVAIMAPTEILARQHAETISELLAPLGQADKVCLLVGSMKTAQKVEALKHIKAGTAQCIIGTHALIQEKVDMHLLGLVVIDEQHRFGVEQRKKLLKKAGHMPHMMSMTATPIPRSLALTLYGDLDISVLREKPPGRKPTITEVVPVVKRQKQYESIDKKLDLGVQVFVVCPLIEESEAISARSVQEVYEELQKKLLPNRRIGLLHGKLKSDEKQQIMQDFLDHRLDVLVSTTVIEVGVDVPNASIICIEGVERFGLAQIHQLRGRVGRGGNQGYCYLFMSDSKAASKRIRAIASSNDGFRLAELDLELRGPGAIYGTMQHGELDLRLADLSDITLITQARHAAQACLKNDPTLLQYRGLKTRIASLQKNIHLN